MKVIILFGPTAVGKTELIFKLFSENYEIINADSMQVYSTLNIGTAKPERALLHRIPHHLIDINPPDVQFHVGDFVRLADKISFEIERRGSVPVISGGTAFYFKNFLYGLPEIPEIKNDLHLGIGSELVEKGLKPLYSELLRLDPLRAGKIHHNDQYRILRALEIIRTSGKPASAYNQNNSYRENLEPLIIGLKRDRKDLYKRIDQRVDKMFNSGLLPEVKECFRSGFTEFYPGMRGIGYREFFTMGRSGEFTISDIRDQIKMNSRRYAKRQLTFFRALPDVKWYHPEDIKKIKSEISEFIDKKVNC